MFSISATLLLNIVSLGGAISGILTSILVIIGLKRVRNIKPQYILSDISFQYSDIWRNECSKMIDTMCSHVTYVEMKPQFSNILTSSWKKINFAFFAGSKGVFDTVDWCDDFWYNLWINELCIFIN